MRKYIAYLLLFLFVMVTACQEEETPEEKFLKTISYTWAPSAIGVTFNNTEVNGVFDTFTLTLKSDKTYQTTDGQNPVWKPSGSFTLKKATTGFNIVRDDGIEVQVKSLEGKKLVISFPYKAKSTARTMSVDGNYVFDLERK